MATMMVHLITSCVVGLQPAPATDATMSWSFESPEEIRLWAFDVTGDAKLCMPQPKVEGGRLTLLESWDDVVGGAVALPFESEEIPERFEIAWTLVMNTGDGGDGPRVGGRDERECGRAGGDAVRAACRSGWERDDPAAQVELGGTKPARGVWRGDRCVQSREPRSVGGVGGTWIPAA